RVYMLAIALFVLGSIACAAAQSLNQLVAARVLQGLGGALLLPVGRLAVLRGFPRDRFLHAMSVIAIPGLVGPLIGPTLGGWLTQGASWHWVFLINIPVGLAGLAATLRYMPDGAQPATKRFDLTGYLYLAFGMMAVSLAVDGLSGLGLKQAGVLVLLVFGMDMASSGNSMLSMVQMLAMSMGVAAAGAVLAAFTSFFGSAGAVHTLHAFQAIFACMGLITLASAGIFWQLSPDVRQVKPAEIPES
ncbi:MAG: MFS transporter, partial [Polaromonas sp.]